ncbi:hypothetical protein [Nostoc sp. CMAA1605]|nr:hypothetical protein [Nostoc sp. CMAA1605]
MQLTSKAIAQPSQKIKAIAKKQRYTLIQYLFGLLNFNLSQLD